jgi:hypothetical protein
MSRLGWPEANLLPSFRLWLAERIAWLRLGLVEWIGLARLWLVERVRLIPRLWLGLVEWVGLLRLRWLVERVERMHPTS